MPSLNYTTIHHAVRKQFGLTMNEYAVIDLVYHLQNNPESPTRGWCHASKGGIASMLDLTEQTVHSILSKAFEKGLIIKQETTRYVAATPKWYKNVILTQTKETLATLKNLELEAKESLVDSEAKDTKESLVNNNIYKKNINNNNVTKTEQTLTKENQPKPFNRIDYLLNVPLEDAVEFGKTFRFTTDQIKVEGERAYDWVKSRGKTWKDYKAFLRNWLRNQRKWADEKKAAEGTGYQRNEDWLKTAEAKAWGYTK